MTKPIQDKKTVGTAKEQETTIIKQRNAKSKYAYAKLKYLNRQEKAKF